MKRDILAFLVVLATCSPAQARLSVSRLRVESLDHPAVLDTKTPRLSWINTAPEGSRGECQGAFRIVVASSRKNLDRGCFDVWDSGKVASPESSLVEYGGPALESGKDYWWKVRVWDSKDKASGWSDPAHWGMGLLDKSDWKASWIEPSHHDRGAPLLRKTFRTGEKKIRNAKLFISGLGYFEAWINGERVGNDYLVPNFTNYTKREGITTAAIPIDDHFRAYRVLYLGYDVTSMLRKGGNVLGVILSGGFYESGNHRVLSFGRPCLLCQLEITMEDGSRQMIVSDGSWRSCPSAILMSGVYEGELYDARKEHPGWSADGYDDRRWGHARLCSDPPIGTLSAQSSPSDKITETLEPVSIVKQGDKDFRVKFDKEIAGWIRLKNLKAGEGDTVIVRYLSESPQGTQTYICKGGGNETYAPRFTWFGFNEAEVTGLENLDMSQVRGEMVNTDVELTATFETSNDLFNRINKAWQQSQLDNMHGCIPSDCPHRERLPYTGDGQATSAAVMHNFDAAAFYRKWIRDMRDVQNTITGYEPNGAPWEVTCGGGVGFGAAMCVIPWEYYRHYGNRRMLEESYFAMTEEVRYMLSCLTKDSTMLQDTGTYWMDLGDWNPPEEHLDRERAHTFFLWQCADLTAKAAHALGKEEDKVKYARIAGRVRNACFRKFYDKETRSFGDYGANVFALEMGVPKDVLQDVRETLAEEITVTHDGHIHTGIFGTKLFFEVLAANGLNDIAFGAMNKTTFPSFGYWLAQGALTTWEQWDGGNSHNHPMYGGALCWFYRSLAGVNISERDPGYKEIILRPVLTDSLEYVSYSNMTVYGKVASSIRNRTGQVECRFEIPVGCRAIFHLPAGSVATTTENGKPLGEAEGISILDEKTLRIGQGDYDFIIEKEKSPRPESCAGAGGGSAGRGRGR